MNAVKSICCILVTILLCACAITPRISTWESPKHFTKTQVFNAALEAGTAIGYTTTSSDRESGTMSFTEKIANGNMILNVRIVEENNVILVRTTANYAGDLAIAGMHEEEIRKLHKQLFRALNISEPQNIHIEELN